MKNYKNYPKNQALRKKNSNIKKIVNGKSVSFKRSVSSKRISSAY